MHVYEPTLEYDPYDPWFPFTLSFKTDMADPYELYFTEEQMKAMVDVYLRSKAR